MRILPAEEAAKIALAKRGRTSKIGAMAFQLEIAEIAQEKQKRLMKHSTRKRIAKLNKVSSFNKKVNAAAQVIYRSKPIERALFKLEK